MNVTLPLRRSHMLGAIALAVGLLGLAGMSYETAVLRTPATTQAPSASGRALRWTFWLSQFAAASLFIGLVTAVLREHRRHQLAQVQEEALRLELEARTRALAAANHELDAFAYSVSHDLRAPLRIVDGFSRVLAEDHAHRLDADGMRALERVQKAARVMDDLTEGLLTLSRVGRTELARTPVNISILAESIADDLRAADPHRRVTIDIAPHMMAEGDARLVRAVLANLVGNAWKFTATRAVARIEVGTFYRERSVVYYVKDNGVGFDMAYVGRLFGAFQRLHREPEFTGTGIGLATVQRIVHLHGGRAWATSAVGEGATFYFTLGGDTSTLTTWLRTEASARRERA